MQGPVWHARQMGLLLLIKMNNEYQEIDMERWERRELYEHFSHTRQPHYAIAANIDVTKLLAYKRENGLSFYLVLIFLATESLNSIENFKLRMAEGRVVRYATIHPNFTHKRANEQLFHFYPGRRQSSLRQFVSDTSEAIAQQTTLFGGYAPSPNLVYFSCNPAVDATAITNPGLDDPEDAIPRINWGRYVKRDGRWLLNITITVNHRFIDGYHIGLFFERLQALIDTLQ